MSIKSFFSNWIVKNLAGAAALLVVLVAGAAIALSVITHHGQEIAVPDFTNMSVAQARQLASASGLRVEVTDSVYVRKMGRGLVFSQVPKAGGKVKNGRRILLTINSVHPKKVSMPDLVGFSMRQAKAELMSRGLTLGRLRYVEDMATNNVLKQLYRGREIKSGRMIESGAEIDLVVGLGKDDTETIIPDVAGMRFMRAVDALHDNSLNVSSLHFDRGVKNYSDSLDAVVYKQVPEASDNTVPIGSNVALYLKLENKTEN
ncbi:MAG: PASTA domain-containing protein [Candidatus Cryptobacteroides sp.]